MLWCTVRELTVCATKDATRQVLRLFQQQKNHFQSSILVLKKFVVPTAARALLVTTRSSHSRIISLDLVNYVKGYMRKSGRGTLNIFIGKKRTRFKYILFQIQIRSKYNVIIIGFWKSSPRKIQLYCSYWIG